VDTDGLNDHPDLQNLRQVSKRERRKLQAEARRRQRQAFGMPPEPSFLRRHRTVVMAAAAIAALVAAGVVAMNNARPGLINAAPLTTGTAPATTGTAQEDRPGVDLAQPFLNTPAAGWADGEAGIVAPAAAPVGSYTAEEVAAGYERVRQVVVMARLDRAVIEDHDYARYLALLAPSARTTTDMSKPSPEAAALATRIADGHDLLPVSPKVTGSMWAEEDADGALLVHTNYVIAYAFAPTDPEKIQDTMDIVVVDRTDADYTITNEDWEPEDQGVWPGDVTGHTYAMACDAHKRGELAPSYSDPAFTTENGEPYDEKDAFDPKSPISTTTTCPD
jgi:hypothetical protein